jgi:4'-phosphopantetheinyl transferase
LPTEPAPFEPAPEPAPFEAAITGGAPLAAVAVPVGSGLEPVAVAVEAVPDAVDAIDTVDAVVAARAVGDLTPGERRRCAALRPHRAAEFARGRSLLRRLIAAVLGPAARRLDIDTEPGGRPRLAGTAAGVSLSHTAAHTAAAVWTGGDVGVDVEEPPDPLPGGLVVRCCHDWSTALLALPPRARSAAFARVWTAQEACVKALGTGLAGLPWRIPVDPAAGRGVWGPVRWSAWDALAPTAVAVAVRPADHHSLEET